MGVDRRERESVMTDKHPEIRLESGLIYLNHAAVAPWPERAVDAVKRFADENGRRGAAGYSAWLATETRLRERLARLINAAGPDDIALLKSTSEGLSAVAYGLDWRPGDNIVIFRDEFPSNRIVWESLAERGVQTRQLPLDMDGTPEDDVARACDGRTRLVSVSSVQYATGFRLDLERIGSFCREREIFFCVDAIQSLGAIPFDVEACGADFVAADGHKWMLGPEGLALFWCRPELRDRLRLHQLGWHMVDSAGDFDRQDWAPSGTATRFECGSPNLLAAHALEASLSLLEEVGPADIFNGISRKTSYIIEKINNYGKHFSLVSCRDETRRSGIVTFRLKAGDPAALYHSLMKQRVICALRGGGIRFSPHFYTDEADLDVAFERLLDLLG
jgi:cysteine desulfurase/selenocysteine lyase